MKKLLLGMFLFFGLCIFATEVFLTNSPWSINSRMPANVATGIDLVDSPETTPEPEPQPEAETEVIAEEPDESETPTEPETPVVDVEVVVPVENEGGNNGSSTKVDVIIEEPVTPAAETRVFVPNENCDKARFTLNDLVVQKEYIDEEYRRKLKLLNEYDEGDDRFATEYAELRAKYSADTNSITIREQAAKKDVKDFCI